MTRITCVIYQLPTPYVQAINFLIFCTVTKLITAKDSQSESLEPLNYVLKLYSLDKLNVHLVYFLIIYVNLAHF